MRGRRRTCLHTSPCLMGGRGRGGKVSRSLRTQPMMRLPGKARLSAKQNRGKTPRVPVACVPPQGPFWHSVDTKAEKRLAGQKERRSRFGDVNVHKRYQLGKIFSPFQALATT
ncbi:uncharacterized protein LOC109494430 isoform X3 [Prionailurus iriomotensis]